MVNKKFWSGKKVLITGHTGFKGSWLAFWLNEMGAEVFGYALEPDTTPSLFHQLQLKNLSHHHIADIRNADSVNKYIHRVKPDVIIHMAAQPLVLRSYKEPVYTWETNVLGTIHLLEAVRKLEKKCAVLVVTTDKVYKNREWHYSYREVDRLGGHDPYSSGKAAAELAVESWRESFLKKKTDIRVATARAGNVIGGGDWAKNRLVPDIVRALKEKQTVTVRNPFSVRPWQHVLEPLSGYLALCESLYTDRNDKYQSAFNFAPLQGNNQTVQQLVQLALSVWPGQWKDISDPAAPHESGLLQVSIEKTISVLGWRPKWEFRESIEHTINWYRMQMNGSDAAELTRKQIREYTQA